jgi:hypothetical protein
MSAVLTLEGEGGVSVCWRGWYRGGFCGGGLADRQKGPRHSRLTVSTWERAGQTGREEGNTQLPLGRLRWNLKASRTVTEVGGGVRDSGWFGLPPCVCRDKPEGLFSSTVDSTLCCVAKTTKCRLFVVCIPVLFSKFDASAR